MKKLVITSITIALLLLTSCKQEKAQSTETSTAAPTTNEAKFDPALFNAKLDKGMSIAEAKKLTIGADLIVSGKILGAQSVFVDGRASFIMGDPEILISCDLKKGDNCKTPWDVCCEGKETISKNTISIQVTDESGKVIRTGLKGKNGLKELSLVTVKGTIAPQSSDAVTIINAQAIQVNN